ncbi:Formyltransferase [Meira miltonrushii]|uniref:methionyl-tRNA formyltransferase n=1 Tax=Meira miltonrushii TaxID=1280837 RepID=A0A316VC49_9BASI|nr:Formyltransferase [Meira miltonrushii]PWN35106.1 Formyltransferase [Meira miltonrushii]
MALGTSAYVPSSQAWFKIRKVDRRPLFLSSYSTSAGGAYDVKRSNRGRPFKVLFCGTDDFALECLEKLHANPDICDHIQVLTPADAPNRWERSKKVVTIPPVKSFALVNGLAQHTIPEGGLDEFEIPKEFIKEAESSILLTVSFGHLIPPKMLDHFLWSRRLNVHPSLLPALKGAAPIQWAIARGLQATGVSIQTLGTSFDSGEVLSREEVAIPPSSSYKSLREIIKPIAAERLLFTLSNLQECADTAWKNKDRPNEIEQSHAPMIKPRMTSIRWSTWSASKIEARHRAMGYLFSLRTEIITQTGERAAVLLRDVDLYHHDLDSPGKPLSEQAFQLIKNAEPGELVHDKESNRVLCRCAPEADGNEHIFLQLKSVQTAGKKEVPADQWINGYTTTKGSIRTARFLDAN